MTKKDYSEPMSETGNWNASRVYTEVEIAEPIINATKYLDIAVNGTLDFSENFYYSNIQKDTLKLEGLKRAVNELLKLIRNTFALCSRKGTPEEMKKYKKRLRAVRELLKKPIVYKLVTDINGNKHVSLNHDKFDGVIDYVSDIKEEMLKPIKINDLIMFHMEDLDPKELKKRIIDDAVDQG